MCTPVLGFSRVRQTYQVSHISRETPAFWTPSAAHLPYRQNLPHFINLASFIQFNCKNSTRMHKNSPFWAQKSKNFLGNPQTPSSNISSTCSHNIVNFDPPTAEIRPVVWGTFANFSGFRVLAALLHGTPVLGVSQTLRRWTKGATCIRQGGHHVVHWPTF